MKQLISLLRIVLMLRRRRGQLPRSSSLALSMLTLAAVLVVVLPPPVCAAEPFLGVGVDENGRLKVPGEDEGEDDDMDFVESDGAFASFFDTVIIPAQKQRKQLDPRISVSKRNASDVVRQCHMQVNRRILHADHRVIIVGGGPAGLSAAIYAARAGMAPLVVARDGGQLEST